MRTNFSTVMYAISVEENNQRALRRECAKNTCGGKCHKCAIGQELLVSQRHINNLRHAV